MKLSIDHDRLKGRSLFVGTPMYGGQCHVDYAFAIAQLATLCTQLGISLRFHFLCKESLVMRARNATVDEFLRSGDTHLMFIDADMGFDARDVVYLLAMQDAAADDEHDVVCAPYPQKQMAWDNIAAAVKAGAADEDPRNLARYAGPVVFKPIADGPIPLQQPVQVAAAGTGFMMIRRATFERYRAAYPDLVFTGETAPGDAGPPPERFAYFDTAIDSKAANIANELALFLAANPEAGRAEIAAFLDDPAASMQPYSNLFVSEDFMFCRRVRDAGMKIWACPWMQLTHSGSYTFSTALPHAANL